MKLRPFVVMCVTGAAVLAVANCGSEDGSQFPNGGDGTPEAGTGTQPPGFGGGGVDGGNLVNGCKKLTCADLGINCGPAGDGCGGILENCGTCSGQQTCGGGGTPSVCGGTQGCVKRTCEQLGVECGPAGDGCGGLLDCKQCTAPAICGGGGPSKCGGGQVTPDGGVLLPDGGTCQGRTVCQAGECGPVANGCGGILNCASSCPLGQSCGGGNQPGFCGAPACTPTSCDAQGATCGFIANGCGQILNCGGAAACTVPGQFCGGGGPNKCGYGTDSGAPSNCTGLCLLKPSDCSGPNTPNTTAITGIVYMPNGTLPVYDALVYVPNGTPDALTTGVNGTCSSCAAEATGDPLVDTFTSQRGTRTDYRGRFTLRDVPYRASGIPLVIQKGKWRKQITVTPTRCGTLELSPNAPPQAPTASNTTFGTRHDPPNNHIPRFAVTSGELDSLQCLLRKIGISDLEFTQPAHAGRVNVYHGSKGAYRYRSGHNSYTSQDPWSQGSQNTRIFPDETDLYGNAAVGTVDTTQLDLYDGVLLSCNGDGEDRQNARTGNATWTPASGLAGYRAEMKSYADRGGKIFGSHWHHAWLEFGPAPWGTTNPIATISHQQDIVDITATINTTAGFVKGNAFADWLVNANTVNNWTVGTRGQIPLVEVQHTINAIDPARAQTLISLAAPIPQKTNPASNSNNPSIQYLDFPTPAAVANADAGATPTQCGRFVISDLHVSSALDNDGTFPTSTLNDNNGNCGTSMSLSDQEKALAFMIFDLTSCVQPITNPPVTCQEKTCAPGQCGLASNGCSGQINCGNCAAGKVCRGSPGVCQDIPCVKNTCGIRNCGPIADGCGGQLSCGNCTTPGQICGGSGPNQCGTNQCQPIDCNAQNIHCGPAGNGCGGLLNCGDCPEGQTCGGSGTPGVCGAPSCTPRTCQAANANCGFVANGCGGILDCGTCTAPGQTCGGAGTANQCGGTSGPR